MFFNSWETIWRSVVVGSLAYFALIVVLRSFGKRTLSKMTAYDLVVTVALGSCLATIILSKDVALAEGVTAFVVLCGLQYVLSWLFVRFSVLERWAKSGPSLLVYKQKYLKDVMRKVRVTEFDVLSALRSKGVHWEEAEAVVLEMDGSLAIVTSSKPDGPAKIYSVVSPHPSDLEIEEEKN